jgi:hypothetical protein
VHRALGHLVHLVARHLEHADPAVGGDLEGLPEPAVALGALGHEQGGHGMFARSVSTTELRPATHSESALDFFLGRARSLRCCFARSL